MVVSNLDRLDRLQKYGLGEDIEISPHKLKIPEEFQRKLKDRKWEMFCLPLFGRLIIAKIGRYYYVVDGQHRLEAAIKHAMATVPCVLFRDMTMADAACMFDLLNAARVKVPGAEEFRAICVSEDEAALALDYELLERNLDGWCEDRAVNCKTIVGVRRLHDKYGLDHIGYTLDVIYDIWPWDGDTAVPISPHARVITGFGEFLRPEKMVVVRRGKYAGVKKVSRRWDDAHREMLVEYIRSYYHDEAGLESFLSLAEAKVRGGGGGGSMLGMELLLQEMLNKARKLNVAA